MFKKLLPLVLILFISACTNPQGVSTSGTDAKMSCCEKCECCQSGQCGECCNKGCCKSGFCPTKSDNMKAGSPMSDGTDCPKCNKAKKDRLK